MRISISTIEASDLSKWDEYVYSHPQATLYHLSAWKNVIEKTYAAIDLVFSRAIPSFIKV